MARRSESEVFVAVIVNIVTWRDDNGCRCRADSAGRVWRAGVVSSPRPVRERIEGEGPNSGGDSFRARLKISLRISCFVSF